MALWLVGAGAASAQDDDVLVFAAASLGQALEVAATAFHQDTGVDVRVSAAASSVLARQVTQGAPADIFVSADAAWMDVLVQGGDVDAGSVSILATNRLVLVGSRRRGAVAPIDLGDAVALRSAIGSERLALALTAAVPAGRYAQAALAHLGVWEDLAPQVVETDNVRTALALVGTGAAPFGIVYATDAVADPRVAVAGVFPAESHPPIVYPAGLVGLDPKDAARAFLRYLLSDAGQRILRDAGFGGRG